MDGVDEVMIQTDLWETSDEMPDQQVSKDSEINISSFIYIYIYIYIYIVKLSLIVSQDTQTIYHYIYY